MVRLLQLCIGMFMLQNPSPAKKSFIPDCSPYTEGL